MTKTEAITVLKNTAWLGTEADREKVEEAIRTLYIAERPEPKYTEKMHDTDDLISRQAAIDALRYAQHRFTVADEAGGMGTVKWSEDVIYFAAAENVLNDLPSAQPERTGKWIRVAGMNERCSVCNQYFPLSYFTNRPFEINYCPNCGARMEGQS